MALTFRTIQYIKKGKHSKSLAEGYEEKSLWENQLLRPIHNKNEVIIPDTSNSHLLDYLLFGGKNFLQLKVIISVINSLRDKNLISSLHSGR